MSIPEFDEQELNVIKQTLKERYGRDVEIQLADIELRLNPHSSELSSCPAVYWEYEDCHFIVCKSGKQEFRNQFFYKPYEQFGTGKEAYDDLFDCVITVLRIQADHELSRKEKDS